MDMVARLDKVIDDAIAAERIVGSVTLVARHGELVYARAAGWFDREAQLPMRRDAIFRLASVTKPLVAATALAMVERRLIGLDNAVSDHLPYFRPTLPDGSEARILVRHLLSHTSGLTYALNVPGATAGLEPTDLDHEENLTLIARQPLLFPPGEGWEYGTSIDVLGAIVATIHGGTLDDALHHYVTDPLEMTDTGFIVTDKSRLAIPYVDGPPGLRRMGDPENVLDPSGNTLNFSPSRAFNPKAFQSGGAGAVGTADDLLRFFEAIRLGGDPIVRPETVATATQNQIGDLARHPQDAGQRFGFLGAVIDDPDLADSPLPKGTIRWGGVYGHDWAIDPINGLTILSMTNTPVEGCMGDFPKQIHNAVYDYMPAA